MYYWLPKTYIKKAIIINIFTCYAISLHSCNPDRQKTAYITTLEAITTDFNSFWSYWNKQVFLFENFEAFDTGDATISRLETINLLFTGRYIPIRYKTADSTFRYKLFALPGNIESNISLTIQQMAAIELAHLQMEAKPLPQFSFTDIKGNKIDENFASNHFLVIKCWFINCMPCEHQRPAYEALMEKYNDKNVLFVTFADDKKEEPGILPSS